MSSLVRRGKITPLAIVIVLVLALTVQVYAQNGQDRSQACKDLENVPRSLFPTAEAMTPIAKQAGDLQIELWDVNTDREIKPQYLDWQVGITDTRFDALFGEGHRSMHWGPPRDGSIYMFPDHFVEMGEAKVVIAVRNVDGYKDSGDMTITFNQVAYYDCWYEVAEPYQCRNPMYMNWETCYRNTHKFGYGTLRIYLEPQDTIILPNERYGS